MTIFRIQMNGQSGNSETVLDEAKASQQQQQQQQQQHQEHNQQHSQHTLNQQQHNQQHGYSDLQKDNQVPIVKPKFGYDKITKLPCRSRFEKKLLMIIYI